MKRMELENLVVPGGCGKMFQKSLGGETFWKSGGLLRLVTMAEVHIRHEELGERQEAQDVKTSRKFLFHSVKGERATIL